MTASITTNFPMVDRGYAHSFVSQSEEDFDDASLTLAIAERKPTIITVFSCGENIGFLSKLHF